jgi:hypothetical protein
VSDPFEVRNDNRLRWVFLPGRAQDDGMVIAWAIPTATESQCLVVASRKHAPRSGAGVDLEIRGST